MKDRIRKHISRAAYAPVEKIRRRQAEHTPISIVGLELPLHLPHEELAHDPNLQQAIDYFRTLPDGDHYLAGVALQPVKFAMARRAIRAMTDQKLQLLAIAQMLDVRKDKHGPVELFRRRRIQRQVGKAAIDIVSSPIKSDHGTIRALSLIHKTIPLPKAAADVVEEYENTFSEQDEIRVAAILLQRLRDELAEQQEEARTQHYNPFEDE